MLITRELGLLMVYVLFSTEQVNLVNLNVFITTDSIIFIFHCLKSAYTMVNPEIKTKELP